MTVKELNKYIVDLEAENRKLKEVAKPRKTRMNKPHVPIDVAKEEQWIRDWEFKQKVYDERMKRFFGDVDQHLVKEQIFLDDSRKHLDANLAFLVGLEEDLPKWGNLMDKQEKMIQKLSAINNKLLKIATNSTKSEKRFIEQRIRLLAVLDKHVKGKPTKAEEVLIHDIQEVLKDRKLVVATVTVPAKGTRTKIKIHTK